MHPSVGVTAGAWLAASGQHVGSSNALQGRVSCKDTEGTPGLGSNAPTLPSAAVGETFTFSIPEHLKSGAAALKEGQQVTVAYEKTAQGSYALVELKP